MQMGRVHPVISLPSRLSIENWKLSRSFTAGAGGVGDVGVSTTVLSKFCKADKIHKFNFI